MMLSLLGAIFILLNVFAAFVFDISGFMWGALVMMPVYVVIIFLKGRIFSLGLIFFLCYGALYFGSIASDLVGAKGRVSTFSFISLSSFYVCFISYWLSFRYLDGRRLDYLYLPSLVDKIIFISVLRVFLLFVPIFLSILLLIIDSGFSLLSITRSELKADASALLNIAVYLFYFGLPAYFIAGVSSSVGLKRFLVFFTLSIATAGLFFLGMRVRTVLMGPIIAYMIGVLCGRVMSGSYREKVSRIKRVGVPAKYVTVSIVIFCLIFTVGILSRFYRGQLEVGNLSLASMDIDASKILELTLVGGDLGYGATVNEVINYADQNNIRLYGQSYYRLAFIVIPRSILPDKPENTQRLVASWLRPDIPNMTIPPGIQGDAYINFGFAGILLFCVFGGVIGLSDRSRRESYYYLSATIFVAFFHLARGGFTNPLVIIAVLVFSAYIYSLVVRKLSPKGGVVTA